VDGVLYPAGPAPTTGRANPRGAGATRFPGPPPGNLDSRRSRLVRRRRARPREPGHPALLTLSLRP